MAGGEPVIPQRRRRIQNGFGARVYNVCGSGECNLIAAECPQNGLLHLCDASVFVEVIRDGRQVQEGKQEKS
jgi:phenylacetate-coenzyme A ligase PaaK-like adenylate-forming protein